MMLSVVLWIVGWSLAVNALVLNPHELRRKDQVFPDKEQITWKNYNLKDFNDDEFAITTPSVPPTEVTLSAKDDTDDDLFIIQMFKKKHLKTKSSHDASYVSDVNKHFKPKDPESNYNAKDDTFEDEAQFIQISTTEHSKSQGKKSFQDIADDNDFIIKPTTKQPSFDFHYKKHHSGNTHSQDTDLPKQPLKSNATDDNENGDDDNNDNDDDNNDNDDDDDNDNSDEGSGDSSEYIDDDDNDGDDDDYEYDSDYEEEDDDDNPPEPLIDMTQHESWGLVNNDGDCGKRKLKTAKSIGGHNADLGEYPWMARLVYRSLTKDWEKGACGGTLINKHYVITAAHCCIDDKDVDLTYVRLGEHDIHSTKDCFRGTCAPRTLEVGVYFTTKHPEYDKEKMINDICLVRLAAAVEYSDYIQPICLPSKVETSEMEMNGKEMTVAGWGSTVNKPVTRLPDVIQELNVTVWSSSSCEMVSGININWKTRICAVAKAAAHSPCPGDSGGPLMYFNSSLDSGRQVLMGVVSAGTPCSHSIPMATPAFYTRVSTNMQWILDSIFE